MWPLIIMSLISAAGGIAGSAMQPRPSSFGDATLHGMLNEGRQKTSELYDEFMKNLHQGVDTPSSYIQPLPVWTGGGLPMPIGTTAQDPALKNPGLLHKNWLGGTPSNSGGNGPGDASTPGPHNAPSPGPGSATGNSPGAPGPGDRPPSGGDNTDEPDPATRDLTLSPNSLSKSTLLGSQGGANNNSMDQVLSAFRLMGMNI